MSSLADQVGALSYYYQPMLDLKKWNTRIEDKENRCTRKKRPTPSYGYPPGLKVLHRQVPSTPHGLGIEDDPLQIPDVQHG